MAIITLLFYILTFSIIQINGHLPLITAFTTEPPSIINSSFVSHRDVTNVEAIDVSQNSMEIQVNDTDLLSETMTISTTESEWVPQKKVIAKQPDKIYKETIENEIDTKNGSVVIYDGYPSSNTSLNKMSFVNNYLNEINKTTEEIFSLTSKFEKFSEVIKALATVSIEEPDPTQEKHTQVNELLVSQPPLLGVSNENYNHKRNAMADLNPITSSYEVSDRTMQITDKTMQNNNLYLLTNASVSTNIIEEIESSTEHLNVSMRNSLLTTNNFDIIENQTFIPLKDDLLPNFEKAISSKNFTKTKNESSFSEEIDFNDQLPMSNSLSTSTKNPVTKATTEEKISTMNIFSSSKKEIELQTSNSNVDTINSTDISVASFASNKEPPPQETEQYTESVKSTGVTTSKSYDDTDFSSIEEKFTTPFHADKTTPVSQITSEKFLTYTEESESSEKEATFIGTDEVFEKSDHSDSEVPKHIPMIYNKGVTTLKLAVSITFLTISLTAVVIVFVYMLKMRRNTIPYEELSLVP